MKNTLQRSEVMEAEPLIESSFRRLLASLDARRLFFFWREIVFFLGSIHRELRLWAVDGNCVTSLKRKRMMKWNTEKDIEILLLYDIIEAVDDWWNKNSLLSLNRSRKPTTTSPKRPKIRIFKTCPFIQLHAGFTDFYPLRETTERRPAVFSGILTRSPFLVGLAQLLRLQQLL